MKKLNRLYELCNRNVYSTTDKIKVSFEIKFPEPKEIRRNDVNHLYFSIVDTLISREHIENLHKIREYIRSTDETGYYDKLISDILHSILNGERKINENR